MCRKNFAVAAALIAFGVGVLVGGWIEGGIIRFLLAAGSIALGILILGEKRRHK